MSAMNAVYLCLCKCPDCVPYRKRAEATINSFSAQLSHDEREIVLNRRLGRAAAAFIENPGSDEWDILLNLMCAAQILRSRRTPF